MASPLFVTGASGFVGRAVCRMLAAQGRTVISLDRVEPEQAAVPGQIRFVGETDDMLKPACEEAARLGARICLHLAGRGDAWWCAANPEAAFAANAGLTWRVAKCVAERGFTRLVFPSTAHVYGDNLDEDADEQTPLSPRSAYAASKVAAEACVATACRTWGMSAAMARLSNLYGPGMGQNVVLGKLCAQLAAGEPVDLYNFSPQRDFLWLDDAAQALIGLCDIEGEAGVAEAVNVSTGKATSVYEAAVLGLKAAGREDDIPLLPVPGSPTSRLILSNQHLKRLLGVTPKTTLEQGLLRILSGEA